MPENTAKKCIHDIKLDQSGLPDLVSGTKALSYFEFWPSWLFYFPMKLYGLLLGLRHGGLTLPTVTNPLFDVGGFIGESKSQILDLVPNDIQNHFSTYVVFERGQQNDIDLQNDLQTAKKLMDQNALTFPCVAKPDKGERGSGVQCVYDEAELKNYLRSFPSRQTVMLQALADFPFEAGLFYIRHPEEEKGRIFSLTLKYFPHVTGDGQSTLKELILKDRRAGKISHLYLPRHEDKLDMIVPDGQCYRIAFAGSHSKGAIFKDGNAFITPKMEENWDRFCKKIPEFYFGRFDIRFHSMKDLENVENLKIIEINGSGAEATHIWDSETSLSSAYKTLMVQYSHMFKIGAKNKKRGFEPMNFSSLMQLINDHQSVTEEYPITH